MSSRKLNAGTSLGDDGSARETRRCFKDAGNGALKENVDVEGSDNGVTVVASIVVGGAAAVVVVDAVVVVFAVTASDIVGNDDERIIPRRNQVES